MHIRSQSPKISTAIAIQFDKTRFLLFTMKSIKGFGAKRRAHTHGGSHLSQLRFIQK